MANIEFIWKIIWRCELITKYNKLIRDGILEIIKESGKECNIKILDNKEYITELNKKLKEE